MNKLVVQLTTSEDTDFDQLIHIEEALIKALLSGRLASVAGHGMGEDRFNIFIHLTGNWEPVFDRVTETLDGLGVLPDAVIVRFHEDSETVEVVHPASYAGTFAV